MAADFPFRPWNSRSMSPGCRDAKESTHCWVRRIASPVTSSEHAEIRKLKREVAELRRANEILKSASAFFAAEFDRPATK